MGEIKAVGNKILSHILYVTVLSTNPYDTFTNKPILKFNGTKILVSSNLTEKYFRCILFIFYVEILSYMFEIQILRTRNELVMKTLPS